ncbi:MAG: GNAT family N-acetyltransferase [Naasia sp.]
MTDLDARTLPLDPESADRLDSRGLRMELVDTSDSAAFDAWLRADSRGFHDENPDAERLSASREALAYRRTTAVTDPTSDAPTDPVATVSSWVADLTVSPGRSVDAWAISAVTVRPTHTGRGVARAMLEGELRTASAAGLPLAALTVSEATLYGRYGFAPAAMTADWTIKSARATWMGPVPAGRVDLIDAQTWRDGIDELHERVRRTQPGHIEAWGRRWDQLAGLSGEEPDRARRLQAARYSDEEGVTRGLLLYRVTGGDADYAEHTVTIENLSTETDDAYAALWRLALTIPLANEVVAPLRRIDEPVRWQIADYRSMTLSPRDNLWLRILDVPAALTSRRWDVPGVLALDVTDPLGFSEGSWVLTSDAEGGATVTGAPGAGVGTGTSGADADGRDQARISLGIAELSAVYLGGVSVESLARAGRIRGDADSIRRADAIFRASTEPWLPFWF